MAEWIAPCHFGLEAVARREIENLGLSVAQVEDGRVTFTGSPADACRANICLRTVERVMLKVAQFKAVTFDELFEATRALPWEDLIPRNGKFWVTKASSVKSTLFSTSDIQSIMKKAMVERLKSKYHTQWFPEDGSAYPLRVTLNKDIVTIGLDTTGQSLHRRGYRRFKSQAPITETLAAALLMLTPWRADRILVDPFCGSGTFPIEAAMMAANIAPGIDRAFIAEDMENLFPEKLWVRAREQARTAEKPREVADIQGYDIDPEVLRAARRNAQLAGVEKMIHFQERSAADFSHAGKYGFVITNPPYGERMAPEELSELYKTLGEKMREMPTWSFYLITSYEDAQREIGRKADKNRKIYNGMMKTYFYQYMGEKPPKRRREEQEK